MMATKQPETQLSLTYSTDLLQNYVQGSTVSPTSKFQALQTSEGQTLLFGLDSSNQFHVIKEQNDVRGTGWTLNELSTTALKVHFADQEDLTITTFGVWQSALDQTIGLSVAVRSAGSDSLLVSLQNSSSDLSWTENPNWSKITFDAANESRPSVDINNIWFSEIIDQQQYLVVDIDRAATPEDQSIARYYIDPFKPESQGPRWEKHALPVDIEKGKYKSCLGRVAKASVDGIYTIGAAGASAQLLYVPIFNEMGIGPPSPRRYSLPDKDAIPTTIATARRKDGNTDLYVVGGSTLYRVDAAANDLAIAEPVITNDLIGGTDTLQVMIQDQVVTLFGKNRSNQAYYLSCDIERVTSPEAWNIPVPVVNAVEHISAYVNRADGGNTIFASGGQKIYRVIQATRTRAKLWRTLDVKVAAPATQKLATFKSYTTTIHVSGANNMPVSNAELHISTDRRTPVYIDGVYYVLGEAPVTIETDASGVISVVEETENINASILTVTAGRETSATAVIDPMSKSFEKLAQLTSVNSLRGANFPADTKAGGVVGSPDSSPLVDPSVKEADAQAVIDGMKCLKQACSYVKTSAPRSRELFNLNHAVVPSNLGRDLALDGSIIALGDLFQLLKSEEQTVMDILWHAASEAWQFVARIAGKVYHAILDTVDAIVGAVEWIFSAVKTGIKKIIQYVEFLFEWDDIRRTKDVIHNITKLFLQRQIDGIGEVKQTLDKFVETVETSLNKWAGISDWSALGDAATKPAIDSARNPTKDKTPGSQLLANHYLTHANDVTVLDPSTRASFSPIKAESVKQALDHLVAALDHEKDVFDTFRHRVGKLAEELGSISVADVLKKLVVIFLDAGLSSAQVVVDLLLDLLKDLATEVLTLLDTKIHVPVISDILNEIGIPDLSFLDLFTWISATNFTVVYKIATNTAPFPDNEEVRAAIAAKKWDDLAPLFGHQQQSTLDNTASVSTERGAFERTVFTALHSISGGALIYGATINVAEAECSTGDNPFSFPSAVVGAIATGCQLAADWFSPRCPLKNGFLRYWNYGCAGFVVLSKFIFSSVGQSFLVKFGVPPLSHARTVGATINLILVAVAAPVTWIHFAEILNNKTETREQHLDKVTAVLGEVSNLSSSLSKISYVIALIDPEPDSRQIFIASMGLAQFASGGLQLEEALVGAFT